MTRDLRLACLLLAPFATAAQGGELCLANRDTALFADAALSEELRPVFQYDGVQFVPDTKSGETMLGMAFDVRMQPLLEEASHVRASDWTCEALAAPEPVGAFEAFDVSPEACQRDLSDTRVTLTESGLSFYESSCDIVSEETDGAGVRLLSMQCYGEGNEWPAQGRLTSLDTGGFALEVDGYTQTYVPCGKGG